MSRLLSSGSNPVDLEGLRTNETIHRHHKNKGRFRPCPSKSERIFGARRMPRSRNTCKCTSMPVIKPFSCSRMRLGVGTGIHYGFWGTPLVVASEFCGSVTKCMLFSAITEGLSQMTLHSPQSWTACTIIYVRQSCQLIESLLGGGAGIDPSFAQDSPPQN